MTEVVEAQVISVGSSSSAVLDDYGVVRIEITDVLLVLDEAQAPALQVAAVTDARSFDPGSFATGRTFVMFLANDPRFGDDAWSIEFVFDQATNRPAAQSDDATTSDVIRQVLLEGEDESDLLGALMALVGEYQVTQGEMTPRRNHLYPP